MLRPFPFAGTLTLGFAGLATALLLSARVDTAGQSVAARQADTATPPIQAAAVAPASNHRQLLDKYCVTCHNEKTKTAGLLLDKVDVTDPAAHAEIFENVVDKLRNATMPPGNMPQPTTEDRRALIASLETSLDRAASANPNPGRTETLRRLNRTEYQNAIRDLLALDIDASSLLPPDESGHGFDNVTVGDLPPALLDRYLSAAQKISRLAIGSTHTSLQGDIIRVPPDVTQEDHVPGLPIGTRGGVLVPYTFAQTGDYDIQIWLARTRDSIVGGLRDPRPHELTLLVDREPVGTFTIQKPSTGDDTLLDANLKLRVAVTAGPHDLGVTFIKEASSLLETARQPLQAHFNETRHPRITPAIAQVSVTGPYEPKGVGITPSRQRLFVCARQDDVCARQILTTLVQRAYRRPVSNADVDGPIKFYEQGRAEGNFDAGIGRALSAVLISPEFLFRVEAGPAKPSAAQTGAYRISDLELASRLSFFLWSSIPDDELLDAAIEGRLSNPVELEKQTRRMLADPRSFNIASNFAGQWLRLRNVKAVDPNVRLFPDFDDNLRDAMRQETELFIDSVRREDRSVLDLIRADYTFLNERLARHYGIPNVYGSRMRRVAVTPDSHRGGLLRHASVLSVTSYANRTSPILRGVWVLDAIYGAPPPPPAADVPSLDEGTVAANLPMRERLAAHRTNPTCAQCHRTIDPVGFALENFDAVGRWRDYEGDSGRIDVTGALPGSREFQGVTGLEDGLLSRPDLFASTLTRKLLTFALGRGIEHYDGPAVRRIVRDAAQDRYRFSSLIVGIVKSVPFRMRREAARGEGAPPASADRAGRGAPASNQ